MVQPKDYSDPAVWEKMEEREVYDILGEDNIGAWETLEKIVPAVERSVLAQFCVECSKQKLTGDRFWDRYAVWSVAGTNKAPITQFVLEILKKE